MLDKFAPLFESYSYSATRHSYSHSSSGFFFEQRVEVALRTQHHVRLLLFAGLTHQLVDDRRMHVAAVLQRPD